MSAVEMKVEQVTIDPVLGTPVVILKEKGGERSVPIWIGQGEAAAIVSELRRVPMNRPSTHDLMKDLIFRLRASVTRVLVTDLQNGTFFAEVELTTLDGEVRLDARPSDAIALALRVQSPILVEPEVMERAWGLSSILEGENAPLDPTSPKVLIDASLDPSGRILESLNEEDFGKWKM